MGVYSTDVVSSVDEWDAMASAWESFMADGNSFHRLLVQKTQLELMGDRSFRHGIELACGNGNFLLAMSARCTKVTGIDGSAAMLRAAAGRAETASNVVLKRLNLETAESVEIADANTVDLAVCTMALMDIPRLDNLAHCLNAVLAPNGYFIFTMSHPSFWGPSPRAERSLTFVTTDGEAVAQPAVTVYHYKTTQVIRARADHSMPTAHRYFCRSLEETLRPFLSEKLVIDKLVEPTFPKDEVLKRPIRPDEWRSYPEIPPIIGLRLRKIDAE